MVYSLLIILLCLIIFRQRIKDFYYNKICGRRIYYDKKLKTIFLHKPFDNKQGWKGNRKGLSYPLIKL